MSTEGCDGCGKCKFTLSLTPQQIVDMYDLLIDHDVITIGGSVPDNDISIEVSDCGFYIKERD